MEFHVVHSTEIKHHATDGLSRLEKIVEDKRDIEDYINTFHLDTETDTAQVKTKYRLCLECELMEVKTFVPSLKEIAQASNPQIVPTISKLLQAKSEDRTCVNSRKTIGNPVTSLQLDGT